MVTVVQATGLPIADKAMLIGKGSSDPFVTLTVTELNTSRVEPTTKPNTKPSIITGLEKPAMKPTTEERGRLGRELACVKTTVKKRNLSPVWKEKVHAHVPPSDGHLYLNSL